MGCPMNRGKEPYWLDVWVPCHDQVWLELPNSSTPQETEQGRYLRAQDKCKGGGADVRAQGGLVIPTVAQEKPCSSWLAEVTWKGRLNRNLQV